MTDVTTSGLRITVVGASDLGCEFALLAQRAGHHVTLVDEHPQTMSQMSLDAPWFYGAALPAPLANENATAQSVLQAAPQLAACFEAGVDVRVGTVAWGAFQNGPNSQSIGDPRVGLADAEGNTMLTHDVLILATGTRDIVPSFRGSDLPGVFGVKAGLAFLDLYQCYEGRQTLVLGTSDRAVEFVRRATARGVRIVGMVEPGKGFAAGTAAASEISALGIPILTGTVILSAEGQQALAGARLCSASGQNETLVSCDSICMALGVLPNIEIPAAMGCKLRFDPGIGCWLPETDAQGRTSQKGVFWLSRFASSDLAATLAALGDPVTEPLRAQVYDQGRYLRDWIAALHRTGGDNVILCKCESVSRSAFLNLRPPSYLRGDMRHPQGPMSKGPVGPKIHQDQVKRMTRVGMGHCQGRRCRDEAMLLMSLCYGVTERDIQPGSYRFPVRPLNLWQISAQDIPGQRWSYWMHEPETTVEQD